MQRSRVSKRFFAKVGSPPKRKKQPKEGGTGAIARIKRRFPYLAEKSILNMPGRNNELNYEEHIGNFQEYMNTYLADPLVRTLIDLPCQYASKDGWDIVTEDDKLRERIEELFIFNNIDQVLYLFMKNARVFGTGYLEWTEFKLVPRSSREMYVNRFPNGEVEYYYQMIDGSSEDVFFEPNEIIELKNNPFDDYGYGFSDVHTISYLVELKDYALRDIGIALNKFATTRFDVKCGTEEHPYSQSQIDAIADFFNTLEPGEDVVHGGDILVDEVEIQKTAFEYSEYLKTLIGQMHMAMRVPAIIWESPEQARVLLEPLVRHLQAAVESVFNSQLMPQLGKGNDGKPARFKFRHINVDEGFTQAKRDMIYLSEGVKRQDEIRKELGLDPSGFVEPRATIPDANISGGRDQNKQEESQRTEQSGRA